MKEMSKAK